MNRLPNFLLGRAGAGAGHDRRSGLRASFFLLGAVLSGCAGFNPADEWPRTIAERSQTAVSETLSVTAAALDESETRAVFGTEMFARGIQPVWARVENHGAQTLFLMPHFFDPLYYSSAEAAFINHSLVDTELNGRIDAHYERLALPTRIEPGETHEGYLFVPIDLGAKPLNFVYIGDNNSISKRIVVRVPGLAVEPVDPNSLYDETALIDVSTYPELWAEVEKLPCCVTDRDGAVEADPLNFVVIASRDTGFASLVGGGWDQSETVTSASAIKTTLSFLFGSAYRYSPVSDLYAFGRKQDAAFQVARADVDERNHLRVWLTPLRFQGIPVWLGAISRDIGVILSGFGTTHKIDPNVDDERWYLAQSFIRAQALKSIGFARGGPISTREAPRSSVEERNIFYSDGRRIVLELSEEPVSLNEIKILELSR